MSNLFVDYTIIIFYMLAVVGIGILCTRKDESTKNYLLGDGKIPFFAVGLSMMMALFSSISIVQAPGEIFNNSMTYGCFNQFIVWLQIPIYLMFTAFYAKLGSFTPYEYLEYRYDSKVRLVVAISAFYAKVVYLGLVLYSTAKIFEGIYGWNAWFTILLVGVIGTIYTVMGGRKAVIWTDVMQFVVLSISLIVIVVYLIKGIRGGFSEAFVYAFKEGHGFPDFAKKEFYQFTPYVRLLFWLMFFGLLTSPFNVCSDQTTIQNLLCTGSNKERLKSLVVSAVTTNIMCLIIMFFGCGLFTYFAQNPDAEVLAKGGDVALFRFVFLKVPSPISGLFMAAMLAAIMSSLDSGINSMAAVWLKEFHVKFFNKNITSEGEIKVLRLATFIIGLFSILLALALCVSGKYLQQSMTEIGTIFWLLGAATVPAFLFGVLTNRANSAYVWGITFFAVGETIATNAWYILSRRAVQVWEQDPTVGLGWGGPIAAKYFIIPAVIALILVAPYLFNKSYRKVKKVIASALVGTIFVGLAFNMFVWWFFSNIEITDEPKARSFAFYIPTLILWAIVVFFCPKQPRENYQGLTLATMKEPILKKLKDN